MQVEFRDDIPYDPTDKDSIVEYASTIIGSTLREKTDAKIIENSKKRKGAFGDSVEYCFFGIEPNSVQGPDFPEVGLELKTTPLKKLKSGKLAAKERLVITMIDYMNVVDETFETSTLLSKASDILLMSYLYEKDADPLDYVFQVVAEWGLPEEDMPILKKDWETIVSKVRAGHAEDISGSDTLYLEACTKAANSSVRRSQPYSDVPAKPRAWALKASYMTAVQNRLIDKMQEIGRTDDEKGLSLLDLVRERFSSFIGLTEDELIRHFGLLKEGKRKPKNTCALITKRILGVDEASKIAEFEKAGIKPKTIRLTRNGRPKEAVSFPAFDYIELAETDFWESDFYGYLQQKYLFVIYRESSDGDGVYRLSDVVFWQMPEEDLCDAEKCYKEMQKRVIEGHADDSVRSLENRCCHVRPHARNASDTRMTPYGVPVVKKCFWLNQSYLSDEIAKAVKGK